MRIQECNPIYVAGWTVTSKLTCGSLQKLQRGSNTRPSRGFKCSFDIKRNWAGPFFIVMIPLGLAIGTVWLTFVTPLGAMQPRVAVTALAYIGMGATLNNLGDAISPDVPT